VRFCYEPEVIVFGSRSRSELVEDDFYTKNALRRELKNFVGLISDL
jgi:hypothetical protein